MVSRWWNEDRLESCFHKSNFWAQLRGSSVIISRHEMRRKGKWNLDEKLSVQTFKWPQVGISKLSTQTWREYWNMSWWGICWRSLALVLCKWKWNLRWSTQTSNTQWDGQLFQKKCTDKLAIQSSERIQAASLETVYWFVSTKGGQLEYEVQWDGLSPLQWLCSLSGKDDDCVFIARTIVI